MSKVLGIFDQVINDLSKASGKKRNALKIKVEEVIVNNYGLQVLKKVKNVFEGKSKKLNSSTISNNIVTLRFVRVTSAEDERSFSLLKYMWSDRRLACTEKCIAPQEIQYLLM